MDSFLEFNGPIDIEFVSFILKNGQAEGIRLENPCEYTQQDCIKYQNLQMKWAKDPILTLATASVACRIVERTNIQSICITQLIFSSMTDCE